jgi:hypothetical protein
MKSPALNTALVAAALIAAAPCAFAQVTLSFSTSAPVTGALDQFTFNQAGAPDNLADYTDNNGAPGQSFTTPGQAVFLESVSFKIAHGNSVYGNSFDGVSQWGLQIARFDNLASGGFGERLDTNGNAFSDQYLNNPVTRLTYSVTAPAVAPTGDVWLTFTFAGADRLQLNPGSSFAFSMYSPDGYIRIYRSDSDSYSEGTGFRPYGALRTFADNYVQTAGFDRTFHVGLTAVPEPSSAAALVGLAALGLVGLRRRRRA